MLLTLNYVVINANRFRLNIASTEVILIFFVVIISSIVVLAVELAVELAVGLAGEGGRRLPANARAGQRDTPALGGAGVPEKAMSLGGGGGGSGGH